MEKLRARSDEEKAQRKQSIIDALAELLEQQDSLPSANEIAKQAGVTKGVIYRYFTSREEIYIELLLQVSLPLAEQIINTPFETIEDCRELLVRFFCQETLFTRLSLMAPVVLENNVPEDVIRHFKLAGAAIIDQIAEQVAPFAPGKERPALRGFVNSFYQLALMKWLHCHPPENVQKAFADEDFWLIGCDLESELRQSFDWLWLGMLHQKL